MFRAANAALNVTSLTKEPPDDRQHGEHAEDHAEYGIPIGNGLVDFADLNLFGEH